MSASSDEEWRSSSDGEELYSTDDSDTSLGWTGESDSEGFSTDVSDYRKRFREISRVLVSGLRQLTIA